VILGDVGLDFTQNYRKTNKYLSAIENQKPFDHKFFEGIE
jgi:hypothetical protein